MVFALKTSKHYLYVVTCEIYTNNKSLKYFYIQEELNLRQHMPVELIADYDITFINIQVR